MGLTYLNVSVANPARPEDSRRVQFLVDSGAMYSIVPRQILEDLGIRPHSIQRLALANGSEIQRALGSAYFEYDGGRGASPVIFGEPGDALVLGAFSLEAMGFIIDPIRRQLRPAPMVV